MKRFWGFVIKEFYHIFRDYRTMVILFGMPAVQILLFGFAITNEIKDAKIAILDNSKDEMTRQLTNKILSSGYFILNKDLTNEESIYKAFRQGDVKEVIVFQPNFADHLLKDKTAGIQILADASEPNTASELVSYTQSIIADFQQGLTYHAPIPYTVSAEVSLYYNPELKSVFMFVPGLITVLLNLICAMMTSISITREKEMGTMEVLIVSPLRPIQIIIGKVVPYIALAFLIAVLILLLGVFVFAVPIKGNVLLLLAEIMLFIINALCLGILISSFANTQQIAMMVCLMLLLLPTILLSGFIFPVKDMPAFLRVIADIMPAKWFVTIVKNIMLKGVGFQYVWKETLILISETTVFILVAIFNYKTRLE